MAFEYMIVDSNNIRPDNKTYDEFCGVVSDLLDRGWKCQGGGAAYETRYGDENDRECVKLHQAMIREIY